MQPNFFVYEINPRVVTQGDTSTPSVIEFVANQIGEGSRRLPNRDLALRVQVCNNGTFANSTNATIAPTTGYGETVVTHTSTKDLTIRSIADAAATGTLTISGVVINGETAVIGGRTYYFSTGLTAVPAGNVAVDISAGGTKSQGTLTVDTQPTAGDTMTIGSRTYAFVANGTADNDGEISVGTDLASAKLAIVAAINGTDSVNTANASVTAAAFATDDCVLTARYTGIQGDTIVTTETFTAGTNVFDDGTLGTTEAGVDVSASEAGAALETAVNGDASAVVSAADTSGTVVITADDTGVAGNSIATTETMANGAFGAATLTGGSVNQKGRIRVSVTDGSAETVTLRIGPAQVSGLPANYADASVQITHAAP